MIKVLWFEVTAPKRYGGAGQVIGGWQDALERVVQKRDDIELFIAFEAKNGEKETKVVDGITYVPFSVDFSFFEKIKNKWDYGNYAKKLAHAAMQVVDCVKPDLVHVFGTEWPFGLIAKDLKTPVVIHIMGAMVPYVNALYAPNFKLDDILNTIPSWNIKKRIGVYCSDKRMYSWRNVEKQVWRSVPAYMGRTEWDRALSNVMHPGRRYFHVDEALRGEFVESDCAWQGLDSNKTKLITVGCSSFWKGPDMLLQTAKILTDLDFDFEWVVAGKMDPRIKKCVEKKFGTRFEDNHVQIAGFVAPSELSTMLSESTLYVHTAYIENSPNSICEAQYVGLPVVSTNVGGISSLVRHQKDGFLVPANDPWQMANAIVELAKDKERMLLYSNNGKEAARNRHSDEHILNQLLDCYRSLL